MCEHLTSDPGQGLDVNLTFIMVLDAQPLLLYSPREVYPNGLYQSPALLWFFCLKPLCLLVSLIRL